jgi:hypothetical protein
MELNPLLQIQVTPATSNDLGLNQADEIHAMNSFVHAVERARAKKNHKTEKKEFHVNRISRVPDKLLKDIVSFSPEALKCSRGEECPY